MTPAQPPSGPGLAPPTTTAAARPEDGFSTIEVAILFPAVLLIVMALFQVSLYWHTANAAEVAAEEGVDAGQVDGGDAAAAEQAAAALLAATTTMRNPSITAAVCPRPTCPEATIQVVVEVDAPRIAGLGTWRVRSVAEGRLEEFIPADER